MGLQLDMLKLYKLSASQNFEFSWPSPRWMWMEQFVSVLLISTMHKFSACWRYNTPCTSLFQRRSLNQLCLVTLWTKRNHIFSDKGFLQHFYILKWWVLLSLSFFHYLWLFTSPYLLRTTRRELFCFWLQLVPQTAALSSSHRRHQPGIYFCAGVSC